MKALVSQPGSGRFLRPFDRWHDAATRTIVGLGLLIGSGMGPAEALPLPDTFLARVEALASMQTLNAEILASRSATTTLETWCADHGIGGKVTAIRMPGMEKSPRPEQRHNLDVDESVTVKYRRVRLTCGGHVVSEADNWYVPSRLTPEMNRLLETTDTPFGKVVAPLAPTRRTFEVEVLWDVLKPGWEMRSPPPDQPNQTLEVPLILFEHHVVLYDAAKRPFSEVAEHYTREILSFGAKR